MKLFPLLVIVILAGCIKPLAFTGLGKSDAELAKDSYECERDTRMVSGSFQVPRQREDRDTHQVIGDTLYERSQPDGWGSAQNFLAELQEQLAAQKFRQKCMEARGWKLKE